MRPSSVSLPVETTTPVARPDTTMVPENAMLSRSPTVAFAGTASTPFSAGTDFPGKGCFFGPQVLRLDQAQVGGNLVAGLQKNNVPRNKLLRSNHAGLATTHRPGLRGQHVANGIQRLLRLALLYESEQRVENDDTKDDRRIDPQVQHQLGESCGKQHVDQDVVELCEKPRKRASLPGFR